MISSGRTPRGRTRWEACWGIRQRFRPTMACCSRTCSTSMRPRIRLSSPWRRPCFLSLLKAALLIMSITWPLIPPTRCTGTRRPHPAGQVLAKAIPIRDKRARCLSLETKRSGGRKRPPRRHPRITAMCARGRRDLFGWSFATISGKIRAEKSFAKSVLKSTTGIGRSPCLNPRRGNVRTAGAAVLRGHSVISTSESTRSAGRRMGMRERARP
mmetsp:Transcript_9334/g.23411  ORF Transcript_9334/g.23411 Transcript_9334/m.23411 type:complete len:213 (+) Transcript_9334:317-955(+)